MNSHQLVIASLVVIARCACNIYCLFVAQNIYAKFYGVQIKTESGAKAKLEKTGIYKKWKERSHKRVSLTGTNEGNAEDSTGNALSLKFMYFSFVSLK